MHVITSPRLPSSALPTLVQNAMAGKKQLSVETFRAHAAEDVLKKALEELKWKNIAAPTSGRKEVCDIYWRGIDRDDPEVPDKSYVARIPGMSTVSHKAELAKHLNRMRQFFPEDFEFFPRTWLLPDEEEQFTAFVQSRKGKGRTPTYIVKPDEGAQGEGIFLIQNPRDLTNMKLPSIVQEYVSDPYLLQGLKFDMRLYILVSGLDPPEVFISNTGMVRLCTVPYQPPSIKNLHQTFMHLTNYSLNKRSKDFVHSEEGKEGEASKRTLTSLVAELEAQGCDVAGMWRQVGELVGKTVVAILPQLMVERKAFLVEHSLQKPPSGFQVLGFDVLLDSKLHPHLLEVNAHPSLRVDAERTVRPGVVEYLPSAVDMEIKLPVVRDTLRIIGNKIRRKGALPDDCCFQELFPAELGSFSHLRLFERCSQLYIQAVGVRGGLRMGPSAFRAFARHYNLCNAQFTSADVDILYIDMSRRHGPAFERNAMSFHCFCHALISIANKLYPGENTLERLLDHCSST